MENVDISDRTVVPVPAPESKLVFPADAREPHLVILEDGSTEMRWHGSVHPDSNRPDAWAVSAEPGAVHACVDVEGPWWLSEVEQTLREVLRYQSGVNIHLSMRWTTH